MCSTQCELMLYVNNFYTGYNHEDPCNAETYMITDTNFYRDNVSHIHSTAVMYCLLNLVSLCHHPLHL